ncbi:MAG: M20 family metallopeptidase [Weeksellaceae bacterium]
MIDEQILDLAQKLISVPSTKDKPEQLQEVLEVAKQELADFTIEEFASNGIPSILVYFGDTRPEKFKVILNAHLDVVPAQESQFKPEVKDGKLYGRGAYDMKAAGAVELLVFKELAKKVSYPLALQLVTDEEIGGHNGAKYQIEQGVRADFVIAGENTDLTIINRAKGVIWAKIITKGATAHGAYPWLGKNALIRMNKIVEKINTDYPIPTEAAWKTTINVATMETTNDTFNKVPDLCELKLDIRFIPEDAEKVEQYILGLKTDDIDVEIMFKEPLHFTPEDNEYVRKLKEVIGAESKILPHHGASDIRHFNVAGVDGIEFGPRGAGHHTDSEWVEVESLQEYYEILHTFLLQLN